MTMYMTDILACATVVVIGLVLVAVDRRKSK